MDRATFSRSNIFPIAAPMAGRLVGRVAAGVVMFWNPLRIT
jgi:hypothetical protein